MSAEIFAFPVAPRLADDRPRPRLQTGDIVVTCINATLGLWCAWPVAMVDDDGVVIGVFNPAGKMMGVDRVNCQPDVYAFRAADHQAGAFADLRWKTWRDAGDALLAFARIGVIASP